MTKLCVPLAFLAALAASTTAATASANGIAIPLVNRGSGITTKFGTFNISAQVASAAASFNKIQSKLRILQDKGIPLPEGAQILDYRAADGSQVNSKRKRAGVPLNTYGGPLSYQPLRWAGTISVGTPPQSLTADFDTVSSDMWVISSQCKSCGVPRRYDAAKSSTAENLNGTFDVTYDDGSRSVGTTYSDVVTVGNVTAKPQIFAALSLMMLQRCTGMASGIISQTHGVPFFYNALAQGAVGELAFSFRFDDKPGKSEFFIGGSNPSLYKGAFEMHQFAMPPIWYSVGGGSIAVNGQKITNDTVGILGTSSSVTIGPIEQVKAIHAQLPDSVPIDQNGMLIYAYPCANALSNITVTFPGGRAWPLTSQSISWFFCTSGIVGVDLGLGDNYWPFGQPFLRNAYTRVDLMTASVQFAELS